MLLLVLSLGALVFAAPLPVWSADADGQVFSFAELEQAPPVELPQPEFFKTSDNVALAYYVFSPGKRPAATLVFIHGGGACSAAGYAHLAQGLKEKYRVKTYLLDLRGHGASQGVRGDAPTVVRVWEDLKEFQQKVRTENAGAIFLGGHSSGGGLILNYLSWPSHLEADGYFFVAPEFGYKSDTVRIGRKPFANIKLWVFMLAGMTGGRLLGHQPAVFFNYPDTVLARQPFLLKSITRNFAVALTPNEPGRQFSQIKKAFGLFVGQEDELFDPVGVLQYAQLPNQSVRDRSIHQAVPESNHLSILLKADDLIGAVIRKLAL